MKIGLEGVRTQSCEGGIHLSIWCDAPTSWPGCPAHAASSLSFLPQISQVKKKHHNSDYGVFIGGPIYGRRQNLSQPGEAKSANCIFTEFLNIEHISCAIRNCLNCLTTHFWHYFAKIRTAFLNENPTPTFLSHPSSVDMSGKPSLLWFFFNTKCRWW